VIEVKNFEELEASLARNTSKERSYFLTVPMDPRHISTGSAYGGAVNQRGRGAVEAAKYGAVGVIVSAA
jgi:carboxypeptidase Q